MHTYTYDLKRTMYFPSNKLGSWIGKLRDILIWTIDGKGELQLYLPQWLEIIWLLPRIAKTI